MSITTVNSFWHLSFWPLGIAGFFATSLSACVPSRKDGRTCVGGVMMVDAATPLSWHRRIHDARWMPMFRHQRFHLAKSAVPNCHLGIGLISPLPRYTYPTLCGHSMEHTTVVRLYWSWHWRQIWRQIITWTYIWLDIGQFKSLITLPFTILQFICLWVLENLYIIPITVFLYLLIYADEHLGNLSNDWSLIFGCLALHGGSFCSVTLGSLYVQVWVWLPHSPCGSTWDLSALPFSGN